MSLYFRSAPVRGSKTGDKSEQTSGGTVFVTDEIKENTNKEVGIL